MNRTADPAEVATDGFTVHISGDVPHAVVRIAGELDMLSAPRLDSELTELTARGYTRVDLDLAGLTFLAAAGLAVLAAADRRCREAPGRLRLMRPTSTTLRLLMLTGLDTTLEICC